MSDTPEIIEDRVVGHLAQRVLALENRYTNKWEEYFGQKPWVVIAGVCVALVTAFWVYHTWQIDRMDRLHNNELDRIKSEHKDQISWLKEKHQVSLNNQTAKCELNNQSLKKEIESCKQNITKSSTLTQ
ncbi:hypothetical protein FAP94_17715 [Morganella morganii]|nr:hypothetical protein [Morganella morganii]